MAIAIAMAMAAAAAVDVAFASLKPDEFKFIIVSIPNLMDPLLQLGPNDLKTSLVSVPVIGGMIRVRCVFLRLLPIQSFIGSIDDNIIRSMMDEWAIELKYFQYQPRKSQSNSVQGPNFYPPLPWWEYQPLQGQQQSYYDPVQEIFATRSQIRPELADSLCELDIRNIEYIVSNHANFQLLLLSMQPRTLQYVLQNVPSIHKKLDELEDELLGFLIRQLPDMKGFLESVDPEVLQRILIKVPGLDVLDLKPKPKSVDENTYPAPSSLFTTSKLEKIRPLFPKVDHLLSRMSMEMQVAVRFFFPHISTAIMKLESDDLTILNANVLKIANQLSNVTLGRYERIVTDERDNNVLRKILRLIH
ncbi:hypothetical protein Aperf_G00000065554 [Anoplocephala perfoliata]